MKKLPRTLLLTIFTATIILTTQHSKPQNRSENSSLPNYKATIFLLHTNFPDLTSTSIATVQGHQMNLENHNVQSQTIYLNAFIILFRYLC